MLLNPIQARALFQCALENRFAILAVNADSPAAIADCLLTARECSSPIIIETSLWQLTGHSFGLGDPFLGLTRYLLNVMSLVNSPEFASLPVVFHTDHIKGPQTIPLLREAIRGVQIQHGTETLRIRASSISLDSSELTEDENIRMILELCAFAEEERKSLTLEMEAGVDQGVTPTDVATRLLESVESEAPGYLALWAPGVGTSHGLGDQSAFSFQAIRDHQLRATEICGRPIGIALHGSSGLSDEALGVAVDSGVSKVNWSSESLLIRAQTAREYYRTFGVHIEKGDSGFKNTAMDNSLQRFVSGVYCPKVAQRLAALRSTETVGLCQKSLSSVGQ